MANEIANFNLRNECVGNFRATLVLMLIRYNMSIYAFFLFLFLPRKKRENERKKTILFTTHNVSQISISQLCTLHRTTFSIKLKIGFLAASNAHIPSHHYFPSRPFVTNIHERLRSAIAKLERQRALRACLCMLLHARMLYAERECKMAIHTEK